MDWSGDEQKRLSKAHSSETNQDGDEATMQLSWDDLTMSQKATSQVSKLCSKTQIAVGR